MDAGAPAERLHLDPRVLAEPPLGVVCERPPEERLPACVLLVRRAVLWRPRRVRVEELELPPRQRGPQLLELVRVPRAQPGGHGRHCTRSTSSSSASPFATFAD